MRYAAIKNGIVVDIFEGMSPTDAEKLAFDIKQAWDAGVI